MAATTSSVSKLLHSSITPGWVRHRRMLVRPAVMASVGRSRIIGIETTLTAKMRPANTPPTIT
jgi:hypothetical protein